MFSTIMSSLGTKVAAAAAAAAFLAAGAAGASAAFGGPDVADSVQEVISEAHHGDSDSVVTEAGGENSGHGHEACSEATQHALERLNELKADGRPVDNAIEAVTNCGNGSDDADAEDSAHTEDADGHDNPNSEEKSDNADDGINNSGDHAENGKSHANDHAFEGSGNSDAD